MYIQLPTHLRSYANEVRQDLSRQDQHKIWNHHFADGRRIMPRRFKPPIASANPWVPVEMYKSVHLINNETSKLIICQSRASSHIVGLCMIALWLDL